MAELRSLIEANQVNKIGEKQMWGWVKKMFRPINYKVDLETVYLMMGV